MPEKISNVSVRNRKKNAIERVVQNLNHDLRADDPWKRNPEVIKRFIEVRRDYEQLCTEVEYILRKRVADQGVEFASITSRAKTLESFLEKLGRKPYDAPFEQLTDLAGARAVCLYHSDIEKIAQIIRSEFEIIEEVDKLGELSADQFGYGARHFVVRLGKSSSGARYDSLKVLCCEIQVRTVVQDAWAIIQHHMVYKRESQIPSKLQRKLNSLAGLFETVDDQFERIREDRDAYLASVRDSAQIPETFLQNELNFDSFKEYLVWAFPGRALESWDGQLSMVLDSLKIAGYSHLYDIDSLIKKTAVRRKLITADLGANVNMAEDGTLPSNIEPALALTLMNPDSGISWGPMADAISKYKDVRESERRG